MTDADLIARFTSAPYYRLLGIEATSPEPGVARVTLPFDDKLTQLYGAIHGGALLTLADSAMSIGIATALEPGSTLVTVDMSMQFLAPAGRRDIVAEGRLTRRGKRLAFGQCTLTAGETTVATAHGVWALRPGP